MHLRLYRSTSAAAARLLNEFEVPRLGKISNRGLRSRAGEISANSRIKISDKERGQPQSMFSLASEEAFPPLSVNKGHVKSKRRTRIDLVTCSKEKPEVTQNVGPLQYEASNLGTCSRQKLVVKDIGPLQREASDLNTCFKQNLDKVHNNGQLLCDGSTSISDYHDIDLPTNFGKKQSKASKLHQTYHKHRECKGRSKPSSSTSIDEPFDNNGKLLCEGSTSISDYYDTDLPTNFGKKQSKASKLHQTYHKHRECSTAISDYYDTDLPTNFGKKQSRASKPHQTYHKHRESKGRSKPSSSISIDEPFDICPPEITDSTTPGSHENKRKWSPKRQLAEEYEQNESVTVKGNNSEYLFEEPGSVLRPGMILLKHYIPLWEQVNIVNKCRELGCGPGGFYRPGYNDGAKLRLYMMCLGLDWNPQTMSYGKRRHHDNAAPPELPDEFASLVSRALDDSHNLIERNLKVENVEDVLPKMSPDVCIVNYYNTNGRLGLHQDRDESQESLRKGLPVVSISIGDSAEFLYGDQRDVNKAESIVLESGDVLIFGGKSRHIYHGVKAIKPGSAPLAVLESTKLRPGRLNLTLRKN